MKLNRLTLSVGIFRTTLHKWEMASTPILESGVISSNQLTTLKTCHLLHETRKVLYLDDIKLRHGSQTNCYSMTFNKTAISKHLVFDINI